MEHLTKLKDEGKAGLFYAKDSESNLVAAKNAINGNDYVCPVCGCQMYPKTLPSGARIYARKPGQLHVNSICSSIELKKTERSFDRLDPEKFIAGLCHVAPRKKEPSFNTHLDGIDNAPKSQAGTDDEAKLSSFTSLKQVSESGVPFLNAHDKHGDHYVSDFIMTYKFGETFFCDPSFVLGSRIVYARFIWIEWSNKAIVFSLFNESFSVRFRLVFLQSSRKEFKKIWEKIGKFEENEKGKSHFIKYNNSQDFLIASDDWTYVPKGQCKALCSSNEEYCAKCKGMYQAIFANPKQVYMIPAER